MSGTICIYIADACIIDYILLFSSSNAKSYRMECTIILALGKLNNCCCTKVFVAYYYTRSTYGDDVSCFPQGDNNCSKIARQRRFRMDIFSLMKRVLEKQRQYHQLQLQQKLYNQQQHMHLQLLVYLVLDLQDFVCSHRYAVHFICARNCRGHSDIVRQLDTMQINELFGSILPNKKKSIICFILYFLFLDFTLYGNCLL